MCYAVVESLNTLLKHCANAFTSPDEKISHDLLPAVPLSRLTARVSTAIIGFAVNVERFNVICT
jgi:hypothetical protein